MPDQATAALERGQELFAQKEYERAAAEFATAVRLQPQNALYHAWLARAYSSQNNTSGTQAELVQALQLDPRCALAYFVRGRARQKQQKDHDGAIQDYTRTIELDPNYAFAYTNRGNAYLDKGDVERAIQDYTRATELDPKYASAYTNRGNAYFGKGDVERAIEDYTRAIELDPECASAYANRRDAFRKIGNDEGYIADQSRVYSLEGVGRYYNKDRDLDWLYGTVKDHLERALLPRLRAGGSCLVDYYPCCLMWGRKMLQGQYEGTSTYTHYGRMGMGYLCLTDRDLQIVSLGEASQKFCKSAGIIMKLFYSVVNNYDYRGVEKQDKDWTVPYAAVHGVQRVGDTIDLITSAESWEITLVAEHGARFLTGVEMGRTGKLMHLWDAPPPASRSPAAAPPAAGGDTLEMIKKLGELHAAGILSDEEFAAKKKDLLSRL